jgi:adenosylhomocysteine nucleosidase
VPGELLAEFGIQRPKVRSGLIISGDRFIADNEMVKGLIEALPNAQCVEMEGAAVAQVCFEHKVPVIVMRTISDRADHSAAIDFPKFVQRIASKFTSGVLKQLIAQIERPISRQLTVPL